MTGRHTRLIVLTVLATVVVSMPVFAQVLTSQELADLRVRAEQGNTVLKYDLEFVRDDDEGVPQHEAESVSWFYRAVEQGFSPALGNLWARQVPLHLATGTFGLCAGYGLLCRRR